MRQSRFVQYKEIDRSVYNETFMVAGRNMNLDWKNVRVGQIVHIAPKEEVRPSSVGSAHTRLFGKYVQHVIVAPNECCDLDDPDEPGSTICPKCVKSWCWDYVVRYHRLWTEHGTYNSFSTFGCRCPKCLKASSMYQDARKK